MVVTTKIEREETNLIKRSKNNIMIYGRRKVGKTFLVKNFMNYDLYILVKRGGGMLIEGGSLNSLDSYDQFVALLSSWVNDGKTIAIDEFQRLPDDFLDHLQNLPRKGKIILTGSSFHLVKDIIAPGSPILGLYSDLRLSLIRPIDIFKGLLARTTPTRAFELSPYLRDPWTIPYFEGKDTRLEDILNLSKATVKALIGEVFLEENKTLSNVYEGIIRALSVGKWKLNHISDLLYSRKIIDKPDPHLIRPYFNNMEKMDLVKRVKIFKKKEYRYLLKSPFMETSYYMDEKYDFFQQDISEATLKKELSEKVPRHVEQFCGGLFAQIYDGRYEYFYSNDFDIDFVITRGGNPLASGEVKWKDNVSRKDVDTFLKRTRHIGGDKIIFSKKEISDDRVLSLTPENILSWIEQ